jgi:hypothetical protein
MRQKKAKKGRVNGTVNKLSIECGKSNKFPKQGRFKRGLLWRLKSGSIIYTRDS